MNNGRPTLWYTTPETVVRETDKAVPGTAPAYILSQDTEFRRLLMDYIPAVGDYINRKCERFFVPVIDSETYYFVELMDNRKFWRNRLTLDNDLLAITGVDWNGVTVSVPNYRALMRYEPPVIDGLLFAPAGISTFDTEDIDAGITVTGMWGYHPYLPQAYTVMQDVTIGNSSTTTVTVADTDAYEIGWYLKCESEWLQITAIQDDTHLTVLRGVNGSTAASHSAASLQRWNVPDVIKRAATAYTSFVYEKRVPVGNVVQVLDGSIQLDSKPPLVDEIFSMMRPMRPGTP